jgi:glycosyltransferase involved in cell wall biosynthesis
VALLSSTVLNIADGLRDRGVVYEIVLVENGSSDGTLQLARLLSAQIAQLRVIDLGQADYGAALAAGFAAARADIVVSFDVDYYDLAFFDASVPMIRAGQAAIVLASKRAPGAQDRRPLLRRILTTVFATIVRTTLHLKVRDAHGMKAVDKRAVASFAAACVMRGSLFDVELVVRATRAGLCLVEIPATVIERRPPRTSVFTRSIEGLLGVFQLYFVLQSEKTASTSLARLPRNATIRALATLRRSLGATRKRSSVLQATRQYDEGPSLQP